MCNACNRCDETTIDKCYLVKSCYDSVIKDRIVSNIKEDEYPLCSRCVHYQGAHSTVFGECWTCNKNVMASVYDNDWADENGEDIVECAEYVFGIPDDRVLG
ncbi:MAG: hypothetical protein QM497_09945 [Sulfurimonas sp.]